MKITTMNISDLVSDPNNARKHDTKNIEAIKGSLIKFGQQKPIVVTKKGIVLAGNGTLQAAKEIGWDKISVYVTDLEGFNASAFAIADNRTSDLASWDDGLVESLKSLQAENFDISLIGFSKEDLESLTAEFEFKDKDINMSEEKFEIKVICKDNAEQEDLFLELRDRGFKVKA